MREAPGLRGLRNRHCAYWDASGDRAPSRTATVDMLTEPGPVPLPLDPRAAPPRHIAQRKRLLSEIQLLTEYYRDDPQAKPPVVVYVGAAPGTHLMVLASMFWGTTFVLYDIARFDPVLKRHPGIFVINEGATSGGWVTTPVIRALKRTLDRDAHGREVLFISDVRMGDDDDSVARGMRLQREWMEILVPKMSLLKFRMTPRMSRYARGDLYHGIWSAPGSRESLLRVKQPDVGKWKGYDAQAYIASMEYHDQVRRRFCFAHGRQRAFDKYIFAGRGGEGGRGNPYCPCYDCLAELTVLHDYCAVTKKRFDDIVHQFGERMNHERMVAFQGPPR